MSVRIKVSYTEEEELARVIRRLSPGIERCRPVKGRTGRYKRAYIDWNSSVTNQDGGKR